MDTTCHVMCVCKCIGFVIEKDKIGGALSCCCLYFGFKSCHGRATEIVSR